MRSYFFQAVLCVLVFQTTACVDTGLNKRETKIETMTETYSPLCVPRNRLADSFARQCGFSLKTQRDLMHVDDLSKIFAQPDYQHTDEKICLSRDRLFGMTLHLQNERNHRSYSLSESMSWFFRTCQQESSCRKSWENVGPQTFTKEELLLIRTGCDPELLLAANDSGERICIDYAKERMKTSAKMNQEVPCNEIRAYLEPTK